MCHFSLTMNSALSKEEINSLAWGEGVSRKLYNMLCCVAFFLFLGDLRNISKYNNRLVLLVHILQVALHAAFYVCAGFPIFYRTSTIEDGNSWGWIWVAGKWIATMTSRNFVGSLVQGSLILNWKRVSYHPESWQEYSLFYPRLTTFLKDLDGRSVYIDFWFKYLEYWQDE